MNEEKMQNPVLPMKWYHFIIYFQLFAGAIVSVITAYMTFTGMTHVPFELMESKTASRQSILFFYQMYPRMKLLDQLDAAVLLATAVLMVITRMKLAKFKTGATRLYIITYVVVLASDVFYVFFASSLLRQNITDASYISNIMMSILLIIANYVYFGKREHLFVN